MKALDRLFSTINRLLTLAERQMAYLEERNRLAKAMLADEAETKKTQRADFERALAAFEKGGPPPPGVVMLDLTGRRPGPGAGRDPGKQS